jgi:predicted DNA-binding transcriptional regulator YafY
VEQIHQADSTGWIPVDIRFQFEEEACEYVLSFGTKIEVVSPESLREKVVSLAESVIKFNSERTSSEHKARSVTPAETPHT